METSQLLVFRPVLSAQGLWAVREGSLSCHTCCNMGPQFTWPQPKDRPIQSFPATHKGTDWLLFYVPFKNISLIIIWRHHYWWRAAKQIGLCLTLKAFEQGGNFIVPHLLWHRNSIWQSHPKGLPIESPLTTHMGMWRIYFYTDPHRLYHGMWRTYSNTNPHRSDVYFNEYNISW